MSEIEFGRMHYRLGTIGDQQIAPASIYEPSSDEVKSIYGKRDYPLTNYMLDTCGSLQVLQKPIQERRGGKIVNRNDIVAFRKNETLKRGLFDSGCPFYIYEGKDRSAPLGQTFISKDRDIIFLKFFGSSSRNGEIMRSLKRGDLTVNVRNIQTVKGSRPIALSLDKPQTTRKVGETMEIRSNEPLPMPMPIYSEQRQFSIGNVVRAELRGDWSEAGFEREMCQEARRLYRGSAKGVVIPSEAIYTRAVMVSSGDVSGAIGTKLHGDKYIDIARPTSSVIAAGATLLEGLQQNAAIPKLNSDTSATFYAENAAISDDDLDVDQITLTPKLCAGTASFTRTVLETSTPKIDELVRFGLEKQIMNRIDSTALNGDGSGANPTGVANTTGINTKVTAGSSTMTHAESLEIIAAVAANNLDASGGVFIIHPNDAATIGSTSKDSGSGTFVYEDGRIAGKRVIESTHASEGECFFGVFRHLYIGMFGGLDLVIDPYSSARNGVIEITASQLVDVAVAYEKAFNKVTLTA